MFSKLHIDPKDKSAQVIRKQTSIHDYMGGCLLFCDAFYFRFIKTINRMLTPARILYLSEGFVLQISSSFLLLGNNYLFSSAGDTPSKLVQSFFSS